jgi:hypothetical protein
VVNKSTSPQKKTAGPGGSAVEAEWPVVQAFFARLVVLAVAFLRLR